MAHHARSRALSVLAASVALGLLASPGAAQVETDDGQEEQPLASEGAPETTDEAAAEPEPTEARAYGPPTEAPRRPSEDEMGPPREQDGGDAVEAEAEEQAEAESLDHEFQLGLRAGAGVPFLFAVRYGSGPPCDDEGSSFCVLVGSGIVDLDLSFGVTPDLEITTMARIGMVGVEPTAQNNLQVGLGIRSYLSPESLFKFFLGVRVFLDLTPANGVPGWGDVDLGVRGEAGVQLDFVRYFGLYVQIGVNFSFLRSFAIAPDATGGLQVRFP